MNPGRWILPQPFALLLGLATLHAQAGRSTVGSGQKYRTTIDKKPEGELSVDDARQASLLASRVAMHMDRATRSLEDGQLQIVRPELQQAMTLVNLLRDLLPVTVVTTVVTNARDEEVYRNLERVQEDLIPIAGRTAAIGATYPILDPRSEGVFEGRRVTGPDPLHAPAVLDLGAVEPRLRKAAELMETHREAALAQLLLAVGAGIRPAGVMDFQPLIEAQVALRLAERMVNEKSFEAARMNLRAALARLGAYGGASGQDRTGGQRELEDEIAQAASHVEQEGVADRIHDLARRAMDLIEAGSARTPPSGGQDRKK